MFDRQTFLIWVSAVSMVLLPTRALLELRRQGREDEAPFRRIVYAVFAAAITVAALIFMDGPADRLLTAHMLQHMLIGDLVPLLLVLAVRGAVLDTLLPRPLHGFCGKLGLLRLLSFLTRPLPAFLVWAASIAFWHVPYLYDLAKENEQLHAFEHTTFMVGGLLVWTVLLDPARRGLLPGWRRFGYAICLLAASGVLANVLVLSYRPLYPDYDRAEPRPLHLSAIGDQDLAALVMMVEQLATVGVFSLLLARRQFQEAPAPSADGPQRHPLTV